ncbi:MAG TPA: amidohydrolase family protein [Xanthobacteraceae bacterium]|jgi:aminocarboxymuconate-semialdehyde decarboxylase|nr:amidohydrolase family protein [Xanthobacteraceae bacterium]
MPTIDLHTHVVPRGLIDALRRTPERFGAGPQSLNGVKVTEKDGNLYWNNNGRLAEIERELYDIEAKLEAMDRMRIDVSAISIAPPTYFYSLAPEDGLAAAKLSNDGIAQMVAKYPARLRGMATLPMQDPDAAITELERVVKEYGFKAVELGTSVEGRQLADPSFRPVLKTIAQLGCFIFAHPYTCTAKGGMTGYELFNTIGFPLDEVIMAAHLMFSGALDELKELRILVAHGGGYVPYQIGRFECAHRHRAPARAGTSTSPRDLLRRFYFDALTHDPKSLRFLIEQVGADRIVIGSDNPFDMGYRDPLGELERVPGLTADEREQICCRTAQRLLGEG